MGQKEANLDMAEVHEGYCGAHQCEIKMIWLLRSKRVYWSTIADNCKAYARGCLKCQRHRPLKHLPIKDLHFIENL